MNVSNGYMAMYYANGWFTCNNMHSDHSCMRHTASTGAIASSNAYLTRSHISLNDADNSMTVAAASAHMHPIDIVADTKNNVADDTETANSQQPIFVVSSAADC